MTNICAICTENIEDQYFLPCCHSFCKECIDLWTNLHQNCPICRYNLSGCSQNFIITIDGEEEGGEEEQEEEEEEPPYNHQELLQEWYAASMDYDEIEIESDDEEWEPEPVEV